MSIQLIVSNHLEQLSDRLIERFGQAESHVFLPHVIITQTEGMNNWLKKEMAFKTGIAANIQFKKQFELVNEIYRLVSSENKLLFSVDYLTWQLYRALNETRFKESFPKVADYYKKSSTKRLSLAAQVADLFDQYQVYRHTMIDTWNQADPTTFDQDQWQGYLWKQCTKSESFIDRGKMVDQIIQSLEDPRIQDKLKSTYPSLPFFGMAIITPLYLRLFQALSAHIQLTFFLVNPAPQRYWIEDISAKVQLLNKRKSGHSFIEHKIIGNDLLQNWGRLIKDNFRLLFQDETYLNQYDDQSVVEPSDSSLLGLIQQQIYENDPLKDESTGKPVAVFTQDLLDDESICISACYTPLREVEALYNYLIHCIQGSDSICSPRDILVMTTKIDVYAPLIRAVFDHAPIHLPYTIADDSITNDDNLFSALEALLHFDDETFFAEDVLQLLNHQCICDRFMINSPDSIRHFIERSGIRFGKQGDSFLETDMIGWEIGLQRLIYGLCLPDELIYENNGSPMIPLDLTEGASAHQLIYFIDLVRELIQFSASKSQDRPVYEWINWIKDWVERFLFKEAESDNDDYLTFLTICNRQQQVQLPDDEPVQFDLFVKSFVSQLSKENRASSFLKGGITMCSLIPMRSIPFKVIAILGLNDRDFPRKDKPLSFSLIDQKVEIGDRNIKENDKHLFLETLICAQEKLYMSYIGFNEKTGSHQPPSILIDELFSYIQEHSDQDEVRPYLVTEHPLHGFSHRYNQQNPKLYSYIHYASDQKKIHLTASKQQKTVDTDISLRDLLHFFEKPIEYYFKKHLGIYLDQKDETIPHTEMDELNRLDHSIYLKQFVFDGKIKDEEHYSYMRLNNKLPIRTLGQISFDEMMDEAVRIRSILSDYLTSDRKKIALQYPFSVSEDQSGWVQGHFDDLFGKYRINYSTGSSIEGKLIKDAIQHLFCQATFPLEQSVFLHAKDMDKPKLYTSSSKEIQTDLIHQILHFYSKHHHRFLLQKDFIDLSKQNSKKKFTNILYKKIHPYSTDGYVDPYAKEAYRLGLFDWEQIEASVQFQQFVHQIIQTVYPSYTK